MLRFDESMKFFRQSLNSAGTTPGGQGGGQGAQPQISLGGGGSAKKAFDVFQKNLTLAVPAVALFIAEIVIGVVLVLLAFLIFHIGVSYMTAYSYYGLFAAGLASIFVVSLTALIEGVLTGVFSSITLIEADAALSSQPFTLSTAISALRQRWNAVITLSVVLGVADLIWSFTGGLEWFLDAITNMVFLVSFVYALEGKFNGLTGTLFGAASKVVGWLSKDAVSVLALFVASIFLGFPVLEFAAMPLAALMVLIMYEEGEKGDVQAAAQPPASPPPTPPSPAPETTSQP